MTLTPGSVRLDFHAARRDDGRMARTLSEVVRAGLSVTDNTGQRYQVSPDGVRGVGAAGPAGQWWDGQVLAAPVPGTAGTGQAAGWLEFATESGPAARLTVPPAADVAAGTTEPLWPTAAECYLAVLAQVTAMRIGSSGGTVDLDTTQIIAAVAGALLRAGALPPDSALLAGPATERSGQPGRQGLDMHLWGRRGI